MSTLAFDTHAAVKALKQAGFEEPQAEAVVATVGDAIGDNVATKEDTRVLRGDITNLRTELRGEIHALEARLYRALWIQTGAIIAAVVALVKLIP